VLLRSHTVLSPLRAVPAPGGCAERRRGRWRSPATLFVRGPTHNEMMGVEEYSDVTGDDDPSDRAFYDWLLWVQVTCSRRRQ